jgi:lipopolysaccharide export system protein LptA
MKVLYSFSGLIQNCFVRAQNKEVALCGVFTAQKYTFCVSPAFAQNTLFLWFIFFSFGLMAQQNDPSQAKAKEGSKVELKRGSRYLKGERVYDQETRTVARDSLNQILFLHEGTQMYCDSANQFLNRNQIEAFGNIILIDSDSTVLHGDTLFYDGNTRLARLRGKVKMIDKDKIVDTKFINYDMVKKVAYYFNGGTVTDTSGTVLTSDKGYYNTQSKIVSFRTKVVYDSPDTHLESDTLTYNSISKVVYFNDITRIKTRNGEVVTPGGEYNTVLGTSMLQGRSQIETDEYSIAGDTVDYDKVLEKGIAQGNVYFVMKKENMVIKGDLGKHDGVKGRSEIYGNGLMIRPSKNSKDTLFLSADTLISISIGDSLRDNKKLLAYRNVKVYRPDFQSICDSLTYNFADSMIRFYKDPILWAGRTQMSSDSIEVIMHNGQIDTLNLFVKAFIITQDTLLNFNQIKGREIKSVFRKNNLYRIMVNGNSESVYHIMQNDTTFMGFNRIRCGNMRLFFSDSIPNQLKDILFLNQPEAKFYPVRKMSEEERYLESFTWRIEEKPKKGEVLGVHHAPYPIGRSWEKSRLLIDNWFKVFMQGNQLLFLRQNCDKQDIIGKFMLRVYPVNKNDIPIEMRQAGFMDLSFEFPWEDLDMSLGLAKHTIELPNFPMAKIEVGQTYLAKNKKEEVLWRKMCNFKSLRK